ncbi:MAG: MBL fold metallo-hydrolase [Candidatus Moranbacteria bacterium]|nr:MBL fold metallo-hydrolase [Candidatus Moranbacteria bacterium]
MRKNAKLILLTLFFLVLLGGLLIWHVSLVGKRTEVVFLNIGQGDAILISQGNYQVLIDGGRTSKELLARLGRHIPFWDRTIDIIIVTHPDADHIGGLVGVLRTYQVDQVLTTGAESDTETSRAFQEAMVRYSKRDPARAFRGTKVIFPQGGELVVEYPFAPLAKETNNLDTNEGSIITRFTYGETSFLLTGDLPREETFLSDEQPVTVLKVAHHGSKHSSSEQFLRKIHPKEAVISVGKNSYGHPDPGVLERLQKMSITIHRTDQKGDVRYQCLATREQCLFSP